MPLISTNVMFKVFPADVSYKQKVKLRPKELHYENDGEEPYVKYTCQICEQIAEKANHFLIHTEGKKLVPFSFPEGTEQCPCCGVNIDWEYK